ncbi:MAG: LamG domain-containing protein [Kofleriaceae bacterium]
MKLYLLGVMIAGACGFSPTVRFEQTDARPQGSGDDSGISAAACHVTDPALRLCLDFEDMPLVPTVHDLANHHDGSADNVASVPRGNERAAGFVSDTLTGLGSQIVIAETPDLDIPDHVTYEMYLAVAGVPQNNVWPLDNYGEYGVKLTNDAITCYAGGAFAATTNALTTGWHHVACAYGDGKLRAYVDGQNVACHTTSGPIHDNGDGVKIGADYTGAIDDVHIYARTFDSDEIAQRVGMSATNEVVCKSN